MPRGAPDYSNVRTTEPLQRVDDLSELAARLHSPSKYERGGHVVFMSNFNNGLAQFGKSASGTGSAIVPGTVTALNGAFSARIMTSAVIDQVSTMWLRIPVLEPDVRLGLEAAFCIPDGELGLAVQIAVFKGSICDTYTLSYYTDLDDLYIFSSGYAYYLESNLRLYEGVAAWNRIKLVVDLEERHYVRALLNDRNYDLSSYGSFQASTSEDERIDIRLQTWAREAISKSVYWDDIIVTQHEE